MACATIARTCRYWTIRRHRNILEDVTFLRNRSKINPWNGKDFHGVFATVIRCLNNVPCNATPIGTNLLVTRMGYARDVTYTADEERSGAEEAVCGNADDDILPQQRERTWRRINRVPLQPDSDADRDSGHQRGSAGHADEDPADVFGTMDKTFSHRKDIEGDEGDRREEEYLSRRPNRRNVPWWYGRQMQKIVEQRQLGKALNFFKHMTEVDRAKPDEYAYLMLIKGCGQAGYTKMAFKLYKQMKERGLKVPSPVYTSLFNACANSPFPEDGLKRAHQLYGTICEKAILLNSKTYHAAIKGFGRCKDLQMAFRLVDEMIQKEIGITTETFNFLLSACASKNDNGFLRAIQVWRKLRQKRIKPDIYSYNLLLRTVRDCDLGDPKEATLLLLGLAPDEQLQKEAGFLNQNKLNSPGKETTTEVHEEITGDEISSVSVVRSKPTLPDILSPTPKAGSVISLTAANTVEDRLVMLGGWEGVLRRMQMDRVRPELRTFTQLVEIVPPCDEQALLNIMDETKVAPDVDFFNVLLKKRTCRNDFHGAKDVLDLITQYGLYMDIATFGALANGCRYWRDAKDLLTDMEQAGFRTNSHIMGALVKRACRSRDFWYLIDMMKRIKADGVKVNARMLQCIEHCDQDTKHYIVKMEKAGRQQDIEKVVHNYKTFRLYYSTWLKENEIELPEHPWSAYKVDDNDESDDKKNDIGSTFKS